MSRVCTLHSESLYPPAEKKLVSMRPDTERNIEEIQQAIALLRRHL